MGQFFIRRPVFAMVISLVILLAGSLSIQSLPITLYPQITPPTVEVEVNYPGANAETVEQSIAAPIETEVNGAENLIYFSSKSSSDGRYVLQCTFEVGTDLDLANVDINNRVNKASSKLPAEAIAAGISVRKKSPDMLMAIAVYSPNGAYDETFLSNYTSLNLVDSIARTPGVGSTMIVGQRDYSMRLWLRPDKLTKLGLTAADVANAIREQNVLLPVGAVGQPPAEAGVEFQYAVNTKSRLTEVSEFEDIILRTLSDGSILRVKDVARTELAAKTYSSFGRYNGLPATVLLVYQLPGANALQTAEGIRNLLSDLEERMPPGLTYKIALDNTMFITASINEVMQTFFEALLLVLIVVFIFLGSFRATLIPMLAIPVSLVGTFALFGMLGFSINMLTLFGIILAIGTVVDDAIVVVESVESYLAKGLTPTEATIRTMKDVTQVLIASSLVLCAVFVPVAFMGGITGQLYRQFALTISVSIILSTIVAMSLTPALCRLLLRPRKPMRGPLGWLLGLFNRGLEKTTKGYAVLTRVMVKTLIGALAFLAVMTIGSWNLFGALPAGFVPDEDQGYFFATLSLPDGASMERTDKLAKRTERDLAAIPGVDQVVTLGGLNLLTGAYTSNNSSFVVLLSDWSERTTPDLQINGVLKQARATLFSYPEAIGLAFSPPPIPGLGSAGGFQFELQDRSGAVTFEELAQTGDKLVAAARQQPDLTGLFSAFRANVPQIDFKLDRSKAKTLGVPVNEVFQALQIYLGGIQVNDFTLFGRPFKVMLQAEPEFRIDPDNLKEIFVRTDTGAMVPIRTLATIGSTTGPDLIQRYNMFRTSEISGSAAPGYSSGQAIETMETVANEVLSEEYGYEWTGTAYQEKRAGGEQVVIFALGFLLVFLFLAANYESWVIPLAVLLGLPVAVFGALFGAWIRDYINDVYIQIGLVLLIGLGAKTAILVVEFAKQRHDEGENVSEAVIEAAASRFRPILMTAFSFVLGVVPLVTAAGAAAGSRRSLGTAVFGGMIAATLMTLFVTPSLYRIFQGFMSRFFKKKEEEAA
ncbi:MAG: multidrug efflux RND transporter permease subunit [Planctomycetota bacterium]|nr:multidrug efflux RND transporter permease subunit [Planctomycetota bacterium]